MRDFKASSAMFSFSTKELVDDIRESKNSKLLRSQVIDKCKDILEEIKKGSFSEVKK